MQLASVLGLEGELLKKFERQTFDIYLAGYCLDFLNVMFNLQLIVYLRIINFLKQYINQHTKAKWVEILQLFLIFRIAIFFLILLSIYGIWIWLMSHGWSEISLIWLLPICYTSYLNLLYPCKLSFL